MRASLTAVLLIFLLVSPGITAKPPAPSPPPCGVALTIAAESSTLSDGWLFVKATLRNDGPRRVVLVEPGDGSESGWRMPDIRWSVRRIEQGRAEEVALEPNARCGLMNGPNPQEEVFGLAPGRSRHLRMPLVAPRFQTPGVYEVTMTYVNDPQMPFRWTAPDNPALEPYRESTACTATSNTLRIEVAP